MRIVPVLFLAACSFGASDGAGERIEMVETPTQWKLSPHDEGATHIELVAGEHSLSVGVIEGQCTPRAEPPFTQVQEQRAFASLACTDPQGQPFDFVLVELPGPDPDWPYPVGFGAVVTQPTDDGRVQMRPLATVQIPVGVIAVPPVVAPPAEPEPAADTDGSSVDEPQE